MLDARGRLLRAAPGFVTLRSALRDPSLEALHRYLNSWRGVGAIAPGMAHQDFDWSGEDVVEAISMLLTSHCGDWETCSHFECRQGRDAWAEWRRHVKAQRPQRP